MFGRDLVFSRREYDSWAIRVRNNWKFDTVLHSLRLLQSTCMNTDAIDMVCMTWPPFLYSMFGRDHVFRMRENDSWAILVRNNWKFDTVLHSLRRIQSPEMTIHAIEALFVWRGHHLLIRCLDVTTYLGCGKMIRGRFWWEIIESLTLFFIACVFYNPPAWIPMRWIHGLHDVATISLFNVWTWPCI